MKLKISRNKIIIIESGVIFVLLLLILFMGITKLKKNTPRLFKISESQFEKNKIITIEPNSGKKNNFLYFWLNNDQIGNVAYVNGDYALTGMIDNNNTFFSTIDYTDFKEMSYLLPQKLEEFNDCNIKDIFMLKKFIFQSGKIVVFALDKDGNASVFDDK